MRRSMLALGILLALAVGAFAGQAFLAHPTGATAPQLPAVPVSGTVSSAVPGVFTSPLPAPSSQVTMTASASSIKGHVDANKAFDLQPGYSASAGGEMTVVTKTLSLKNGQVGVVTNNSTKPVTVNSKGGLDFINDIGYDNVVLSKMKPNGGCSAQGCDSVLWVDVTNAGVQTPKTVNKTQAVSGNPTAAPAASPVVTPTLTAPAKPITTTIAAPPVVPAPSASYTATTNLEPDAPQGPEIQQHHINGGKFNLRAGESINCGQVTINGKSYEFVNDRVLVVTNNSGQTIAMSSTDGCGWANSTDFRLTVLVHIAQGCDSDGCSQVGWIDIGPDGKVNWPPKVIDKAAYCKANPTDDFCAVAVK